jgi:MATE family multidrug resistance protein
MNHSAILKLALPAIVSNITVPLLGLVDTAIVGHLGSPVYIGAIAVGGMIFSIIYWIFGFLRAGTSGFTSQALGAHRAADVKATLQRSMLFALGVAVLLLLLQFPIAETALRILKPAPDVAQAARTYFYICIWGAPAVLLLYGFNGWFIGLQNTKITMLISLVQNLMNIVLSLFFVFGLGMKVAGVALGTLLAQYIGLGMAFILWRLRFPQYLHLEWTEKILKNKAELLRFLAVNRDIMLRTLCILAVTTFFTSVGARQGNLMLAANAILIQLFYLFSYFMDGFSNAGEALSGQFHGARDLPNFRTTVRLVFIWATLLAVCCSLIYWLFGSSILTLLTNNQSVLQLAKSYSAWTVCIPLAGFAAFIWDGIFIGITTTRSLFLSMFLASCGFFIAFALTFPTWGNHGLWFSFCLFLFLRGAFQTLFFPSILKRKNLRP